MVTPAAGLQTSIWNNNIRSLLLLAVYPLILGAIVWSIAFAAGASPTVRNYGSSQVLSGAYFPGYPVPSRHGYISDYEAYKAPVDSGVSFAWAVVGEFWPAILAITAIWFLIAYFFNTRMIRVLAHSRPVGRQEEPVLYNLLENLCIARGLPMPRLEIIETEALNAFASGIDQKSYTITVTRGLVNSLQEDELEAVLGHELTHIMNNDVRLLIVSIIFTGMIGFAAQLLWSSMRYSLFRRRRSQKGGPGGFMFMFIVLAILWLGYLATLFTRFALTRRREFMADAGSVELTKNPEAMMRALMRISGRDSIEGAPADIALMCIENTRAFMGLFATHPPIEKRIRTISILTGTPVPQLAAIEEPAHHDPAHAKNPWLRG